ncbi:hypothetical protein [Microbacterium sp.]|uniref:hypothetical protein n=1 Tax=Microbacterium sp. TaxID=51671 RepID=UPI002B54B66C|nr:hypothetical protein [Microbacterium sp.]HWL76873.1 hypothetical protein [Microbacterium sp.]
MRRLSVQIGLGVLILVAGTLLLLEATGVLTTPPVVWAALLAAGSGVFWWVFFADRPAWWAALPGAALAGAAVATILQLDTAVSGGAEVPFFGALSIGFWAVYLRGTARWWAIIPAGALLTIAVVAGVTGIVGASVAGAIFLFGLATTFALVALLPGGARRRTWAWVPAAALTLAGVLILFGAGEWFVVLNYVWPMLVIAAGVFVLWRALRGGRDSEVREVTGSDGRVSEDTQR